MVDGQREREEGLQTGRQGQTSIVRLDLNPGPREAIDGFPAGEWCDLIVILQDPCDSRAQEMRMESVKTVNQHSDHLLAV